MHQSFRILVLAAFLAAIPSFAQPAAGGANPPPAGGAAPGGQGGGRGGRGGGRGGVSVVNQPTSPNEIISAMMGGRVITIYYGRPYSKNAQTGEIRKVWGTLVPWNAAWRAGADEATTLVTPIDLNIGGTNVPAGVYVLYMVPSESGTSMLAISRNFGKWGIPVDETSDLARVPLRKETLPAQIDQYTMAFEAVPPATLRLKLQWETTQYSVDITAAQPAAAGAAAPAAPR